MRTNTLWHLSKSQSAILSINQTKRKETDVEIKSLYSLISTGTERLVAAGQVPISLHQKMRVPYMKGHFTFPLKYGYSLVGEVQSEGAWQGQLVHLMHPHQDRLWVEEAALTLIPKGLSPKVATLASNMETALNAVWDSQVTVGDRVVIIGFGMIGALVTRLLSLLPAVQVYVVEVNEYRQELVQEMGFNLLPKGMQDFDCSFHTSASSSGLQQAIDLVGEEGTIIELSWYGARETTVQLGGNFHYQRKRIISSQVGQISSTKIARWTYKRRKKLVFDLLKNPVFEAHLTQELSLSEAPAFFEQLRTGELPNGLGWVIRY